MALIVEYHVVADMYPVGDTAITAGMLVELDAAGLVIPVAALNNTDTLGIAGDSKRTTQGQTTAYSNNVVMGANGANTRWTENRVSDFYDETSASDKITVYHGGGKFWISDDLVGADSGAPAIGSLMETSANAGNWLVGAAAAMQNVAVCVSASQAYPSGVPGTDTADGNITLGNYFAVVLRI